MSAVASLLAGKAIHLAFPAGPLLLGAGWLLRRWPAARHGLAGIVLAWSLLPVSVAHPWSAASVVPVAHAGPSAPGLPGALVVAWLLGFATTAAVLARRRLRFRRVADRATPVDDPALTASLPEHVRLLRTDAHVGAFTIGLLRPAIVLPRALLVQGGDAVRAALAHELAHVRRKDDARVLLELAARAVWFFHPVVWLLLAWRAQDRERLCDRLALRSGLGPERYAGGLLAALRGLRGSTAVCGIGGRRGWERRLRDIVDERAERRGAGLGGALAALVAAVALPAAADALLVKPVAGGRISSSFGARTNPVTGEMDSHAGIDLAAPRGVPVVAAAPGEVVSAEAGARGLTVVLRHDGGLRTVYAQLDRALAPPGRRVDAGEPIGTLGASGPSTGPHLHFEVWRDGRAVDPVPLLGAAP